MITAHSLITVYESSLHHLSAANGFRGRVKKAFIVRAIAYSISLPNERVKSFTFWFNNMHRVAILRVLGELNEVHPIDCDTYLSAIIEVVGLRYAAAQTPELLNFAALSGIRGASSMTETELEEEKTIGELVSAKVRLLVSEEYKVKAASAVNNAVPVVSRG